MPPRGCARSIWWCSCRPPAAVRSSRVKRIAKLTGFVNATADFTDMPKVINGASDLFIEIFGEAGRHARSAVGAPTLPRGVGVEVEAIAEIEP